MLCSIARGGFGLPLFLACPYYGAPADQGRRRCGYKITIMAWALMVRAEQFKRASCCQRPRQQEFQQLARA
jgi:hypothetical protein